MAFDDKVINLTEFPNQNTVGETALTTVEDVESTQYLEGSSEVDRFTINGDSSDYQWSMTQDETGIVVWDQDTLVHDILWDFEEIAFNDVVVDISSF